ncbi:hypothetical protein V6Z11_D12G159400 [Gossypium hirsutum]
MLATKCGLMTWALQGDCDENEARRTKYERIILFVGQSHNQLRPNYMKLLSVKISSLQNLSPPRRPSTNHWRSEKKSWKRGFVNWKPLGSNTSLRKNRYRRRTMRLWRNTKQILKRAFKDICLI